MEKYVKVRKIGQGSFGCAYLATRKGGDAKHHVVIKEIQLDPRDQANAQREARLLAALDHPNIIACKESFLLHPRSLPNAAALLGYPQSRSSVLCIVTEFADGGDLSQEIARRTARRAFFVPDDLLGLFVQVCLALKHLHDRKILHRDIKPANIFLTKAGVVKLGDLGVATVLSHTLASAQTSIGTPYYTAPEICLGKRYNAKADIWSLGCVLFEMTSFAHAFEGRSQRHLFDNIVRGSTPMLPACGAFGGIQQELQTLIDDMLCKEPRGRPSVNQLIRRPLVYGRIQTFLSERALETELNHTILHGENVFAKKPKTQDKEQPSLVLAQHVRQAEPVARSPAIFSAFKAHPQSYQKVRKVPSPHTRNAKARGRALLSVSRKPRGLVPGVLKRSRPLQKRVPSTRVPAVSKLKAAEQCGTRANGKRPGSLASVQVQAKLRAQIKANEAAAAAVAALPDPPNLVTNAKSKKGVKPSGERIAAFNSKWAAQKVALLPPPPPSKAKKSVISTKLKASARGYPKPVVIGCQVGTKCPPSCSGAGRIRREKAKEIAPSSALKAQHSAVRNGQPSLRERRLEWQAGAGGKVVAKVSPLDDPIILVQQLPKNPHGISIQESDEQNAVVPLPPPTTLAPSLLEATDQSTSDSMHEDDQELTTLPSMANLEFERMVLQLKSIVELATTSCDDEVDDEDEAQDQSTDPSTPPPPPYSTFPSSFPLTNLNISELEDPAFRLALERRFQADKAHDGAGSRSDCIESNTSDQFSGGIAQQAALAWMHAYITSLKL